MIKIIIAPILGYFKVNTNKIKEQNLDKFVHITAGIVRIKKTQFVPVRRDEAFNETITVRLRRDPSCRKRNAAYAGRDKNVPGSHKWGM